MTDSTATSWKKWKKPLLIVASLLGLGGILLGIIAYRVWNQTPDFSQMRRSVKVEILNVQGQRTTRWVGPEAPGWVPLSQVSNYTLMAFVSSEDTSFFQHSGVDLHEIQEAIKKDLKERRFARGASTITQQVIKNVFLTREKTLWRKIREVVWASRMEDVLTKQEILGFYVNLVELGPGIYGVGQAANHYFSKSASELSPRESAFLAMLLPSPRRYHENFKNRQLSDWAHKRVDRILEVMLKMGFIGELEYRMGLEESLWGEPSGGETLGEEEPAQFPDTLPEEGEAPLPDSMEEEGGETEQSTLPTAPDEDAEDAGGQVEEPPDLEAPGAPEEIEEAP